jgi:hypothetical protein
MRDLHTQLDTIIDALAAVDVHALAEGLALEHTEHLLDVANRLSGITAHALQACDVRDVTVSQCGRQTTSWLVEEQHLSRADATRRMWVARWLPAHPAIADALIAGQINAEHARLIIGCVRKLDVEVQATAEADLLELARNFDPGLLAEAARGIRITTGADESAEAAEQRKYDSRWVTLSPTFDGMTAISGMLDPESAATLTAALTPLLTKAGVEDERSIAQRRADGLTNLARFSLSHGDLPDHGGERPTVVVTIPLSELLNGLTPGQLGHGTLNGVPITPATARRLACNSHLIPAVLGGDSEVLDLGRSQRLFSRAQRRAAALRDGGCVFPSCQTELARCELHHLVHHEHGGATDHHNSAYLCLFHHWLVHHTTWTITRNPAGKIEIRRT